MFRWTKAAQEWGKNVVKNNDIFKTNFDLYYSYLLIGLIDGKKIQPDAKDLKDLTDTFPEDYKDKSKLIINMLLTVELKLQGVKITSKEHVKRLIENLIEESGNSLSAGENGGFNACNLYANYGFETMNQLLTVPRGEIERFINAYVGLLKKKLSDKNIFKQ